MLAALTGAGLSAAAGLNAYIPFLLVGLMARFSDRIQLPESFSWLSSWWAIGIGAILLLAEVVLDKVPVVDHVNDAIASFIRPGVGGVIFAATSAASNLDNAQWMQDNPWIGGLLGIVLAGVVHSGKTMARPVVNASTLGLGAPVVSTAEDGFSLSLSLVAIFLPVLVVLALVLLAWLILKVWGRARRLKRWHDGLGSDRLAPGSGATRL